MNKWALLALPFPGVVTACQFLTTAVVVYFLGKFRVVDVDAFRWEKLKAMAPINVVFYLAIFTNGQVLTYSTVETFIAFRSLTPLLVSGVDTLVRGEAPPSRRTRSAAASWKLAMAARATRRTNMLCCNGRFDSLRLDASMVKRSALQHGWAARFASARRRRPARSRPRRTRS